jgi:hypothetical protein
MADYRIIVLTPEQDALFLPHSTGETSLKISQVQTGFEAAAELLAEPALALVVDFQALSEDHVKLLDIARELKVELFGVGAFPAGLSTEHLCGMRLVSRSALPNLLQESANAADPRGVRLTSKAGEFQSERQQQPSSAQEP